MTHDCLPMLQLLVPLLTCIWLLLTEFSRFLEKREDMKLEVGIGAVVWEELEQGSEENII